MNCPHHIQWVVPVAHGLHQCTLCSEVVTRKDVIPKFEDLPASLQARWDAHESQGKPPPAAAPPPAGKPAP